MEGVDATMIATAGGVVVVIAVVATACMFGAKKKMSRRPQPPADESEHEDEVAQASEPSKKPRKRSRNSKKNKTGSEDEEASKPPVPVADTKPAVVASKVAETIERKPISPAVSATTSAVTTSSAAVASSVISEPIPTHPAPEDGADAVKVEKVKKPKETPEQKAARLERQKARSSKPIEEVTAATTAAPVSAVDGADSFLYQQLGHPYQFLSTHSNADGWAVVEDKRKLRTSKKGPTGATDRATSPTETADTPIAPPAPVDLMNAQVSIDGKKVGVIVGPKGATLRKIQELSGTEITIPKDKDAATALIGVSGPSAGVTLAARIIEDLCSKGYSAPLEGEDFSEGHCSVHPMYIPDIIGKQGCVRKAIQEYTGVRVTIPPGVTRDQPNNVKIALAGNRAKVSEAKKLIKELCKYYHTTVTHPTFVHEEMDIPSALYNLIIGVKGSEIKHIQSNYKVSVHIPNENSITRNVLIVGEPHGVEGACRHIQRIVDQAGRDAVKAETLTDAWVAHAGDEEAHEPWMDAFTHPSKRLLNSIAGGKSSPPTLAVPAPPPGLEDSSEAAKAAALAVASQGAWGATISSAEGW